MRTFFIILVLFAASLYALNPLHDARYQLASEVFKKDQGKVGVGGITTLNGDLAIPLNLEFGLSDRVEFGARLNPVATRNYSQNWVSDLDLGLQFRWSKHEILQLDLITGLNNSDQQGMAAGYTTVRQYTRLFYSYYEIRTAFFDGLVGKDFFAVEFAAQPRAQVLDNLALQLGLVMSSGIPDLKNTFSLDLQPGFILGLGKNTRCHTELTLGIASPRSENFRVKFYITNDI